MVHTVSKYFALDKYKEFLSVPWFFLQHMQKRIFQSLVQLFLEIVSFYCVNPGTSSAKLLFGALYYGSISAQGKGSLDLKGSSTLGGHFEMNEGLKDIKRCCFVKKHTWVLVSARSTRHWFNCSGHVTSSVSIRHPEIQFSTYFGVL